MTGSEENFLSGKKSFLKKDYIRARKCFEQSLNDPLFWEESLKYLLTLDLKESNYASARNFLCQCETLPTSIQMKYGLLDVCEYNYEASKRQFEILSEDEKERWNAFYYLANVYAQLGDYEETRKILKTLREKNEWFVKASYELIYLDFIEHDYSHAQQLLCEMKKMQKGMSLYERMEAYITYYLGELKNLPKKVNASSNYMLYRLFDSSEKVLLHHIGNHVHSKRPTTKIYFYEDLDFKNLLEEIKEELNHRNPIHFNLCDSYHFTLDHSIGYDSENHLTSDIGVETIAGTKEIITAYPMNFSSSFDQESYSTSEVLKKKRQRNRKY